MKKLLLILMLTFGAMGAGPTATITVDGKTITDGHITVNRGETVCFDGTSSTDADGDSLTYWWSFGDGGDLSASATPCHTYKVAGNYTVKLKVGDRRDSIPFLTGKTPADYSLHDGWTLVRTQDFEGTVAADEFTCGSITTVKPHSGSKSMQSRVEGDDECSGWRLNQGVITGTEVYISFWEYLDDHGKNNDEMFIIYFRKNFTSPTLYQGLRWQYLNKLGNWNTIFNLDSGNLILFSEGDATGHLVPQSKAWYNDAKWISCGFGHWRQWECYMKMNTNGLHNGVTKIWLNGVLQAQVVDSSFIGSVDMTSYSVFLGGSTYTKIPWYKKPELTCAQNATQLDISMNRPKNFKNPLECSDQAPPNGFVPIFNRYIDDVIILEKN